MEFKICSDCTIVGRGTLGDTLNVGGEGMRGGLLVVDPVDKDNGNALQLIANLNNATDTTTCCADKVPAIQPSTERGHSTIPSIILLV